jgi:hypothetical protein
MIRRIFGETQDNWAKLNLYQRFEQIVVLLLSALVSIVIIVALFNVLQTLFELLPPRLARSLSAGCIPIHFRDDHDRAHLS